jgi:glutamine phosphoribosylpyrophosphate amidotransferase
LGEETGVGLSTGSDSELITQCLSLPPPSEFRLRSADILRNNQTQSDPKHTNQSNGKLNLDAPIRRKQSAFNLSGKINLVLQVFSTPSLMHRLHLGHASTGDPDEEILSRLLHLMSLSPLSYALLVMYEGNIYALRDPFGNRPLTVGMLVPPPAEGGPRASSEKLAIEGWVVSSESCSFPSVCARIFRDIQPGEICKLQRNCMPRTLTIVPRQDPSILPAFCIFEYVYFARPDSLLENQMVYGVRQRCGEQLAIEAPLVLADESQIDDVIISPVPESSIPAALGFAHKVINLSTSISQNLSKQITISSAFLLTHN